MIKIEQTQTLGWEAAIRGMRNPMNSWKHSDSGYNDETYILGENDKWLMSNLISAGRDHSKFLRMINVTMDVTAPLYWWKEFDTYKVGTVSNSCSTMHKIHSEPLTIDDFSHDQLLDLGVDYLTEYISLIEDARQNFIETGDKKWWYQIIQMLPSSYNQKRTIQLNYSVLRNIYHARKNHKLDEWHRFCDWIESLPESWLITMEENK